MMSRKVGQGQGRGFPIDGAPYGCVQACLSCCKLLWYVFLFFLQSGKDQVQSIFLDSVCPLLEILWQWIIQNQGDCFVTANLPSPVPRWH